MKKNDVVQFNENHKWRGSLGIITEITVCKIPNSVEVIETDTRYTVAVPIPQQGTAFIYVMESEEAIEYIGIASLIPR